jgi:hypothetical protein
VTLTNKIIGKFKKNKSKDKQKKRQENPAFFIY